MGVTAAVGIGAIAMGYSVYQGQQTQKQAKEAAQQEQDATNAQLTQEQQQQTNTQNQTANNTASAQARVRALSNPDPTGDTVLTPLSGNIKPTPGSLQTAGKQTLGS